MSSNNPSYVQNFHKSSHSLQDYAHLVGDIYTSKISLGAAPLGNCYGDIGSLEEGKQIVYKAIAEKHINYIDTAPWYGQRRSEEVLGSALEQIPRKAYFIGTKVGRYEKEADKMFDFSYSKTIESVEKSLELLKLDYVDLIQVHDCEFCFDDYEMILTQCLPALEHLKKQGKVRYIGITGYPLEMFAEVLKKKPENVTIDAILSYCRLTLHDNSLAKFVTDNPIFKNIGIINASPTAMGLLTNNGPQDWHPAKELVKTTARKVVAQYQHLNIAKLAVRYPLERHSFAATTLVGCRTIGEMEENFGNMKLNDEENKAVDEIVDLFEKECSGDDCHWEGLEKAEYKKNLTKILNENLNDLMAGGIMKME